MSHTSNISLDCKPSFLCDLASICCSKTNANNMEQKQPQHRPSTGAPTNDAELGKWYNAAAPHHNDNLGWKSEAKKLPTMNLNPPQLVRQGAPINEHNLAIATHVEQEEKASEGKYVFLNESAQSILANKVQKKANDLERNTNGVDEVGFRAFFRELIAAEEVYLNEYLIPKYRGAVFSNGSTAGGYPVAHQYLQEMWEKCPDALKTCQSYLFLLKDIHAIRCPANQPFEHALNTALNQRYLDKRAAFNNTFNNNNNTNYHNNNNGGNYPMKRGEFTNASGQPWQKRQRFESQPSAPYHSE